jgi:hypothetical protein
MTSAAQETSTGTTRGRGAPTRISTAPRRGATSCAATRAIQRPSSPAPHPSASNARAARNRPDVRWANASVRRASSSRAEYGEATCRRATVAGRGSHGAFLVSSGATRRSTALYVARDRSSDSPFATKHSTVSGSNTTSGSSLKSSARAHKANRAMTRTTRRAPGPCTTWRRMAQSRTKGRTAPKWRDPAAAAGTRGATPRSRRATPCGRP